MSSTSTPSTLRAVMPARRHSPDCTFVDGRQTTGPRAYQNGPFNVPGYYGSYASAQPSAVPHDFDVGRNPQTANQQQSSKQQRAENRWHSPDTFQPPAPSLGASHTPYPTHRRSSDAAQDQLASAIDSVYEELMSVRKTPQSEHFKEFILKDDLKRIYTTDVITGLIGTQWSPDELTFIREHMRTVLSILILIHAKECLGDFRRYLFRNLGSSPWLDDDDLPVKSEQLQFLRHSGLIDRFRELQYVFETHVIDIGREDPITIDRRCRLPFEHVKEIGSGTYGKVNRVRVSLKHVKDARGFTNESQQQVFACKSIKMEEDFNKEAGKIKLLKDQITQHGHIMRYYAIIIHAHIQYIILPFADHLDLEVFLHCGRPPRDGQQKYDFNGRFPGCSDEPQQFTFDLLQQSEGLAGALRWLHNDMKLDGERVLFAHMDLKPANILVSQDRRSRSSVGKWQISDFGISISRQHTGVESFWNATLREEPIRNNTAYTAPEIRHYRDENRRGNDYVGRHSDVWSYGCIFSEVLHFALGKAGLVDDFRNERAQYADTDRFWMTSRRASSSYTTLRTPNATPDHAELCSWIIDWLYNLPNRYRTQGSWVDCAVRAIIRVLTVDINLRPDSEDLAVVMNHLVNHFKRCLGGSNNDCGLSTDEIIQQEGRKGRSAGSGRLEGQTSTTDTRASIPGQRSPSLKSPPTTPPEPTRSGSVNPTIVRSDTHSIEELHRGSSQKARSSRAGSQASGDVSSPATGRMITLSPTESSLSIPLVRKPSHAEGIRAADGGSVVAKHDILTIDLPKKTNIVDLAIDATARAVACLVASRVYVYAIDETFTNISEHDETQSFDLDPGVQWRRLSVADPFVLIWGKSSRGLVEVKLINMDRVSRPVPVPDFDTIKLLSDATLSRHGAVAYLCSKKIVYVPFESTQGLTLSPAVGRIFSCVTFNDSGTLLYAWAYGKGPDQLYVWIIEKGQAPRLGHIRTYSKVDAEARTQIIPYTTLEAAVIEGPPRRFFSGVITAPKRDHHSITIASSLAAQVYQDHSLITLESQGKLQHARLEERVINYGSEHDLARMPREICRLKTRLGAAVRFRIVKTASKSIAIICSAAGKVEVIRFGPA